MSARLKKWLKTTSGSAAVSALGFGVSSSQDNVLSCQNEQPHRVPANHRPVPLEYRQIISGKLKIMALCALLAADKPTTQPCNAGWSESTFLPEKEPLCDCWVCDQSKTCARERLYAGYIHQLLPMARGHTHALCRLPT